MASAMLPISTVPTNPPKRWLILLFPSLRDVAFLLPALLVLLKVHGPSFLLGDGDTGWHIRTGEWILEHGTVPKIDLFSFTKPHEPWFAWEWGWDVLFALVHQLGGIAAVAYVNLLILCFVSLLLYKLALRYSGNEIVSIAVTVFAVNASTIHWLARPHLSSWLFVLAFLHGTLSAERGDRKALYWLPFLTAIWANLHASFFVGLVILFTSAVGGAISTVSEGLSGVRAFRAAKPYLLCAAGCLAASFINPYTWHLHEHVFRFLRESQILDSISEYQPINFRGEPALYFELMLLLGAAAALWCIQKGRWTGTVGIAVWAHLGLMAARSIPLYLFVASPWIASMLQDLLEQSKSSVSFGRWVATASEISDELRAFEIFRRIYLLSVLGSVLVGWVAVSYQSPLRAKIDPKEFPEKLMSVVDWKSARVFTYDQWGDYLIYRLYPSVRVFADCRWDLYGLEFMNKYRQILNAEYNCERGLKEFAINTVVLKPDSPLATVLKKAPAWRVVFDDGSFIVFRNRNIHQS